jgi:hypothetical protein
LNIYQKDKFTTSFKVHPNLDKKAWQSSSILRLKSEQKPYPVGADVGILKWSVQLPDEDSLPITRKFIIRFIFVKVKVLLISQLLAQ